MSDDVNVPRHLAGADPTAEAKLDRLLAQRALTSLGRQHPANLNRATRRANKMQLDETHRELKRRAEGRDR